MNKGKPTNQEKGITLVALVFTIVVLVIITAVVMRGVTGDESIINSTEVAAEDYQVTQYKEQIRQLVQGTVVSYGAMGERIELANIAEGIKSDGGFKSVSPSGNDILITTTDGYVFEAYYDDTYGAIYVEYIGQSKNGDFPNLTASFTGGTITAESNGIKTEVIYGGTTYDITSTKQYDVENGNSGWYTIRATSSNGNMRYAWVKATTISDKLMSPTISITPNEPDGEGKWYKTRPVIKITAGNAGGAKSIKYNLIGSKTGTGPTSDSLDVTINDMEAGITRITAWVEDGGTGRSREVTEVIKYDNKLPVVTAVTVNSAEPNTETWLRSNGEIKIEATDEVGIITGYEYEVLDRITNKITGSKFVSDIKTPIKVETDGDYTINITVKDQAGNKSEATEKSVITVKKDTVAPEVDTPIVKVTDKTTMQISIAAGDNLSGIGRYEYYVDGVKKGETTDIGMCTITGIEENKNCNVYVEVFDVAGNSTKSKIVPVSMSNVTGGNTGDSGNQGGNQGGNEGGDKPGGNTGILTPGNTEDIGKTVNYKAKGTTYTQTYVTNGSAVQTFEPEKLGWKIWKVDDNNLYLISDVKTVAEMTLKRSRWIQLWGI